MAVRDWRLAQNTTERIETREQVPQAVLDLIADLNVRLLAETRARAEMESKLARALSIVDAIADHARRTA